MSETSTFSDETARNAEAKDRPYKLWPGANGLHLRVSPTGVKSWRLDFSSNGKRGTITLGQFPKVNFAQAVALAGFVKAMLAAGKPREEIKSLINQAERKTGIVPVRWRPTGGFAIWDGKPEDGGEYEIVEDLSQLSPHELEFLAAALQLEAQTKRLKERLSAAE